MTNEEIQQLLAQADDKLGLAAEALTALTGIVNSARDLTKQAHDALEQTTPAATCRSPKHPPRKHS